MLFSKKDIDLARQVAKKSPCVRRQYGVIVTDGVHTVTAFNARVSTCCDSGCVRDRAGIMHGQSTDMGAEIHAEQAASLIWGRFPGSPHAQILIQGFKRNSAIPMCDEDLYPCHACAMTLKFNGFRAICLTSKAGEIYAKPLSEILEYWEQQWGPVD